MLSANPASDVILLRYFPAQLSLPAVFSGQALCRLPISSARSFQEAFHEPVLAGRIGRDWQSFCH